MFSLWDSCWHKNLYENMIKNYVIRATQKNEETEKVGNNLGEKYLALKYLIFKDWRKIFS